MGNTVDLRAGNNFRVFQVTCDNTWRQLAGAEGLQGCIGVLLVTPATNTAAVLISYQANPPAGQQASIPADRARSLDITNPNLIWVKAASGSPVLEVWVILSSAQP